MGYVRAADQSIVRIKPSYRSIEENAGVSLGALSHLCRVRDGLTDRSFNYATIDRLSKFMIEEIRHMQRAGSSLPQISDPVMLELVELYRRSEESARADASNISA